MIVKFFILKFESCSRKIEAQVEQHKNQSEQIFKQKKNEKEIEMNRF